MVFIRYIFVQKHKKIIIIINPGLSSTDHIVWNLEYIERIGK